MSEYPIKLRMANEARKIATAERKTEKQRWRQYPFAGKEERKLPTEYRPVQK
jgi:hypothetical protein